MLVCITGATGFLGAHTVSAIVAAGHRVRLLVRDETRVASALDPLGVDRSAVDVRVADITDETAVARALRGAESVVHMAAIYSFDSRMRKHMWAVNEFGTQVVLGAARQTGAGLIVHVSTILALRPSRSRVLRTSSPVNTAREPYIASKAAAERVARQHQQAGAPVVITYPAALIGPHDPGLSDQNARLRNALRGLMPIWPTGGFPVGDVRDTAAMHAGLLRRHRGNRYAGPGTYLSTKDYVGALRTVTGRALPAVFLPARMMIPVGLVTGLVQRVWPWHIPAEHGAIHTCAQAAKVDEKADTNGVRPRPVAETMRDTVRWMCETGRLSERQAGMAAQVTAAGT